MTKFINRARQTGKSTMLIHAAYITDSPIIVYDRMRKMCLQEQADKIGCKGVEIFTLKEWMQFIGRPKPKKVMIDEALSIIEEILSRTLEVESIYATFTLPMEELPKQNEKST